MIKIVTAIYSNLYNTELGGRDSRQGHYLNSLRSLLKMSNAIFVCYTSVNEIDILKDFFYVKNNFNENQIIFKTFDLTQCEFHQDIQRLKGLSNNVLKDRCYEIQYNKLFWLDSISNLEEYEKVYWFDAGLSHGGLFPEEYSFGNGFERNFQFNLFNENFLSYLNKLSNEKFL